MALVVRPAIQEAAFGIGGRGGLQPGICRRPGAATEWSGHCPDAEPVMAQRQKPSPAAPARLGRLDPRADQTDAAQPPPKLLSRPATGQSDGSAFEGRQPARLITAAPEDQLWS